MHGPVLLRAWGWLGVLRFRGAFVLVVRVLRAVALRVHGTKKISSTSTASGRCQQAAESYTHLRLKVSYSLVT